MQEVLVVISILAALVFLVRFCYREYFVKKDKCDGCAVNKLYRDKINS